MNCKEKDCSGNIDLKKIIHLRTGCHSSTAAYPCNICGRIHWSDGTLVFNRSGESAYLKNGQIIHKTLSEKTN